MSDETTYIYADLVLDNGGIIRIKCPDDHYDEFYEMIDNCRARGDWWSPNAFAECRATYLGHNLDRVDMRRVVGMM